VLLRTPHGHFPAINIPVVSIVWTYVGLDAQEIEQRINYNQERSLTTTVNDIEHIESNAYNGIGVIKVFFREARRSMLDSSGHCISQTISVPAARHNSPLIIRYSASPSRSAIQHQQPELYEQEIFDLSGQSNPGRISHGPRSGHALAV